MTETERQAFVESVIEAVAKNRRMVDLFLARDFGRQPRIPHAERLALSGAVSIARR